MDPDYHHWLKIDQTVRSWIFATLARDILMEVYDLKFSHLIWARLDTRFMSACFARSVELKRSLSHIKKKESQNMDQYLLEIKLMVDALAMINSPVSNRELKEYTILGLGHEYESLINTISYFRGNATLESLRPILQAQEQRNATVSSQDASTVHQALATAPAPQGRGSAPRGYGAGAPRGHGG
ncbi:unnamed protein product [Cuscuta europaea]|uniref:Uncharacterized protein n=1 Tax=Cuscuta europaea TaxID=41803 RepID=A0A9P1ENA5_CUSEU|nr:unnamed protein product [Cuscuta europaea]